MVLKFDIWHQVLEKYQEWLNSDLWLTLTLYTARSKWQLARTYDSMESFEIFYHVCSNDDIRLTLSFMARSNLLPVLLYENTSWILLKILV